MTKSYLILSDSGGIQEEASTLGKPILILRKFTERQEVCIAGVAKIIGTKSKKIVEETGILLTNKEEYAKMAIKRNLFGDGKAAQKILNIVTSYYYE